MYTSSLLPLLALLTTTTFATPTPDNLPTTKEKTNSEGMALAPGSEAFPDLQKVLDTTIARLADDGSTIKELDPRVPTASGRNITLPWLTRLRGIKEKEGVINGPDYPAYSTAIKACLTKYGDPAVHLNSWQGIHCDPVTLPQSKKVIKIGMFRSNTTGEYQNPAHCYAACAPYLERSINMGLLDATCYDFESRVRIGEFPTKSGQAGSSDVKSTMGLKVLSRDTECQMGFHPDEAANPPAAPMLPGEKTDKDLGQV